mmetsp:Transcript_37253/g.96396  ORF Transcript_37253/g.96396 Transcript_37253/m.96396 type:complete len:87 (-) Transcript_37253:328-588(-)
MGRSMSSGRVRVEDMLAIAEEEYSYLYKTPAKQGDFELIFPFSFRSELTSIDYTMGRKTEQEFVTAIVEEVKGREKKAKRGGGKEE